jgi:nucleoside-diphosphate-sugar epimerase
MKTVVIGGTGHIGTYLVPHLVQAGHEVICISRGQQSSRKCRYLWGPDSRFAPGYRYRPDLLHAG